MEIPSIGAGRVLRLAYEILKKAPWDCPSKAAAVGASVLLVVASLVMSRLAITNLDDARKVREEDMCQSCDLRTTCKVSRVR